MADEMQASGWFVFDGYRVAGPYHIDLLHAQQAVGTDLQVTRKGFTRWHPIAEICARAQLTGPNRPSHLSAEIGAFRQQVQRHVEQLSKLDPETVQRLEAHELRSRQTTGAPDVVASEVLPPQQNETLAAVPEVSSHNQRTSFDLKYMTMRGRLRLGPLRSGWLWFGYSLLSLFLICSYWFRDLWREVVWHHANRIEPAGFWFGVLSCIPVASSWPVWRLTKEIQKMEAQNAYRSTNLALVICLSLVPPLAWFYLQCSANDHWRLHVKNI